MGKITVEIRSKDHTFVQHTNPITALQFSLTFNSFNHSVPLLCLLLPPNFPHLRRKEVTKSIALLWAWSKHHVDYLPQTASTRQPTPVFLSSDTTPPTIETVCQALWTHKLVLSQHKVTSQTKSWAGGPFLIIFTAYRVKSSFKAGNFSRGLFHSFTSPTWVTARTNWRKSRLHVQLYTARRILDVGLCFERPTLCCSSH
jgi:hypothetical protein